MRRKRVDEGLVIVGLVLMGIGSYVLYQGEIFLSRLTVSEGQSVGGVGALLVGAVLVIAGVYFLLQSRK